MLEARGLMVFYENALALDAIDLTVSEGQICGLIGSGGAGKTTLLHALSGLLLDQAVKERRRGGLRITTYGGVFFEGEDISRLPAAERVRRGLVLCRERHPVFPDSSTRENLLIAGHLRSRAQVRESLDMVYGLFPRLAGMPRRPAGFLSGGEQQMLILGMALMTGPRMLLLDEPLLGLQPSLQKDVLAAVSAIRDRGVTVLVSEQYARPVLPLIDFGYILENGILSLSGPGPSLAADPEVTAAYFGV